MPVNKNAQLRYNVLDKCFRNTGRMYAAEDLLRAINDALDEAGAKEEGIKRRQLYLDIQFMESPEGWEIELERRRINRKVYYRYVDPSFSISNKPLNETEAAYLQSALQIFSRLAGAPQFDWINELLPRLQKDLRLEPQGQHAIEFENNEYLTGAQKLPELFQAVIYQKALRIVYRSFRSDADSTSIVHPLYLKQYNKRWFLFAYNTALKRISNYPIDRIVRLEDTGETLRSRYDFSPEAYFEDIIGVTRPHDTKPVRIELVFSAARAPYVLTKPLHHSQRNNVKRPDENGVYVTIEVIPNPELEALLLSFGPDVEVLKPASLRKKLAQQLQQAYKHYDN